MSAMTETAGSAETGRVIYLFAAKFPPTLQNFAVGTKSETHKVPVAILRTEDWEATQKRIAELADENVRLSALRDDWQRCMAENGWDASKLVFERVASLQSRIKELRAEIKDVERDAREAVRDAAAEAAHHEHYPDEPRGTY